MTTEPYYSDELVTLRLGDCIDVMAILPDASVDAIVTDPPYGLGFMGKEWDALPPGEPWARECLRVLRPGGHMLAFGGTRTWHRLAVAVEDAGFEIRDSIAWLYGSGFPKSLDVSKAIDKAAGAEREVVIGGSDGAIRKPRAMAPGGAAREAVQTLSAPTTDDARAWQGWGTALKPAFEPVVVARKPLVGTVAQNVLLHGTGALNIDACRLAALTPDEVARSGKSTNGDVYGMYDSVDWKGDGKAHPGRWPANVVLDESQAAALDQQTGTLTSGAMKAGTRPIGNRQTYGQDAAAGYKTARDTYADSGGASRFFYVAKAPTHERPTDHDGTGHPTVKPLDLIRWLVRLITPPGGLVLDPFAGTFTTGEACIVEGFRCIGIEQDEASARRAVKRLSKPIEVVLNFGEVPA
jgi:hypothetical protein